MTNSWPNIGPGDNDSENGVSGGITDALLVADSRHDAGVFCKNSVDSRTVGVGDPHAMVTSSDVARVDW